jgi:hypothetical protein
MKIFFDTEFIEDGRTIDLISIGMKREDGQELYMVSCEFDASKASDWVWKNVLDKIPDNFQRHPRREIASVIHGWVGPDPEFWAYYADYDWVTLCQLYGRMIDLPKGWPMYCRDMKQVLDAYDFGTLPEQPTNEHCAIEDARWLWNVYNFVKPMCPGGDL